MQLASSRSRFSLRALHGLVIALAIVVSAARPGRAEYEDNPNPTPKGVGQSKYKDHHVINRQLFVRLINTVLRRKSHKLTYALMRVGALTHPSPTTATLGDLVRWHLISPALLNEECQATTLAEACRSARDGGADGPIGTVALDAIEEELVASIEEAERQVRIQYGNPPILPDGPPPAEQVSLTECQGRLVSFRARVQDARHVLSAIRRLRENVDISDARLALVRDTVLPHVAWFAPNLSFGPGDRADDSQGELDQPLLAILPPAQGSFLGQLYQSLTKLVDDEESLSGVLNTMIEAAAAFDKTSLPVASSKLQQLERGWNISDKADSYVAGIPTKPDGKRSDELSRPAPGASRSAKRSPVTLKLAAALEKGDGPNQILLRVTITAGKPLNVAVGDLVTVKVQKQAFVDDSLKVASFVAVEKSNQYLLTVVGTGSQGKLWDLLSTKAPATMQITTQPPDA